MKKCTNFLERNNAKLNTEQIMFVRQGSHSFTTFRRKCGDWCERRKISPRYRLNGAINILCFKIHIVCYRFVCFYSIALFSSASYTSTMTSIFGVKTSSLALELTASFSTLCAKLATYICTGCI